MSIVNKIKKGLVAEKERKLLEIDPDRFYVENIRSFYNLTTPVARFLCELAVKHKLFNKKFGLICPNEECGCIIKSYAPGEPIDDLLTCETCEILGREPYQFSSDSLKRMPYYQLRTKVGTGRSGKIRGFSHPTDTNHPATAVWGEFCLRGADEAESVIDLIWREMSEPFGEELI